MNTEGQHDKVTDEAVSEQAKNIIMDQPPVRNEDEEMKIKSMNHQILQYNLGYQIISLFCASIIIQSGSANWLNNFFCSMHIYSYSIIIHMCVYLRKQVVPH